MVPGLLQDIGQWLDDFSDSLNRWESLLNEMQAAYLRSDHQQIASLCSTGQLIQIHIAECKEIRGELIRRAAGVGYFVHSIKELAHHLDGQWPALWTHRILSMELQLNRIQQLSMSLWVSAFQSKVYVSEMLQILATGKANSATYAPSETHSHEGGFLVNEAA